VPGRGVSGGGDEGVPVTIAKAAEWTGRSERTIQRWITARLLGSWRTTDGKRVVMLDEVIRVERYQRQRIAARKRRCDRMLADRRPVS